MKKLTAEQIESIRDALKKAGFLYVDILHEITDHIASELEGVEGDFEVKLTDYISRHKKELHSFNRKYIFQSWGQSYRALLINLLSFRFAAVFVLLYLALAGLGMLIEREAFVTLMLFVFMAVNMMVSFPGVYNLLKKKDQYSAGEGLSTLNVFVFFPGLFMIKYIRDIRSDNSVVLYFTVLLSISHILIITMSRLKAHYKLRYNG